MNKHNPKKNSIKYKINKYARIHIRSSNQKVGQKNINKYRVKHICTSLFTSLIEKTNTSKLYLTVN